MGKSRKSGSGEGQYPITQANLDKKGKTNKQSKERNTMAAKYLTPKGKELKGRQLLSYIKKPLRKVEDIINRLILQAKANRR